MEQNFGCHTLQVFLPKGGIYNTLRDDIQILETLSLDFTVVLLHEAWYYDEGHVYTTVLDFSVNLLEIGAHDATFVILPTLEHNAAVVHIQVPGGVLKSVQQTTDIRILSGEDAAFDTVLGREDGVSEQLEVCLSAIVDRPIVAELQFGTGDKFGF